MNAATHSLGAGAAWAGLCLLFHPAAADILGGILIAGLAAPWPDLDNLGTWSRRRRLGKSWPAKLIIVRRHPVKRAASWVITRWGTHRKSPTHSLAGGVFAAAAACWPAAIWPAFPLWVPAAVLVGWWSHLALDLVNEKPIRLFWPSPVLVHGLPAWLRCKVGGWGETWWAVMLVAGLVLTLIHLGHSYAA